MRHLPSAAILLSSLSALSSVAWAEVDLKFSGSISSDIRYRLAGEPRYDVATPSQWTLQPYGWSRNENRIRAAMNLALGTKVKAVADAELMLFGFSDLKDLDSATLRNRVDPYYLEVHAAYIDVNNILPHLDLRIGRQVVPWGSADKFNPVSNLNSLDLSDPLLFGRALANNMVRLDYNPVSDLTFTAVVVPVFRPAQLPRTAPVALLDPLRPLPVSEQDVRGVLDEQRRVYVNDPDTGVQAKGKLAIQTDVLSPEINLRNTQIALRGAYKLFGADVALSYYRGMFGVPVPAWSVASGTLLNNQVRTAVVYPHMQVVGLETAGSIEKLGGVGWWAEAAVNFPEEVTMALFETFTQGDGVMRQLDFRRSANGSVQAVSVTPNGNIARPTVVEKTPFVKATLGADYSIAGKVYINLQYVHGFIDEFGAGRAARPRRNPNDLGETPRVESRLGDYFVGGLDVKLLSDRLLLRLFTAIKLPSYDLSTKLWDDYAFTAVLFPQVSYTVWDATELIVGSFVMLGDRSTKFGDAAAGATEVFAKARVSF